MTLRHLEIFLAVCRFLSMTKAAEYLNMTQPAVSKAIGELEAFYRVSLFDRISRRLFLTKEGEALMNYASGIISRYEESVSVLRDASVFPVCRISLNVSAAETKLAGLAVRIREEIPEIDLRITVDNSARIRQMLHGNETDLAVIDRKDDPLTESFPLYREELVFAAGKNSTLGDELTEQDILSSRLLLREPGSGNRSCIEPWLREISYPQEKSWQSTSDEVLLTLCQRDLGIAVLPRSYAEKQRDIRILSLRGRQFVRHFYLVYLKNKYMNRTALRCMEVIKRDFKEGKEA